MAILGKTIVSNGSKVLFEKWNFSPTWSGRFTYVWRTGALRVKHNFFCISIPESQFWAIKIYLIDYVLMVFTFDTLTPSITLAAKYLLKLRYFRCVIYSTLEHRSISEVVSNPLNVHPVFYPPTLVPRNSEVNLYKYLPSSSRSKLSVLNDSYLHFWISLKYALSTFLFTNNWCWCCLYVFQILSSYLIIDFMYRRWSLYHRFFHVFTFICILIRHSCFAPVPKQ